MPSAINGQAQQDSKGYAIFGNLEYDLTPEFTLIGGLRGARDEKHINEFENYYLPCASDPISSAMSTSGRAVLRNDRHQQVRRQQRAWPEQFQQGHMVGEAGAGL